MILSSYKLPRFVELSNFIRIAFDRSYWKGLCAYVLANVRDASTRGVVIGHDHRYNSERWSKLTAAIFSSKQVRVFLYRGLVHTPLVPFGVKKLNAACGVMITGESKFKTNSTLIVL